MKTEIHKAVDTLRNHLKKDSELFHVWQYNIAMAFKDEYGRNEKKYKNRGDLHEIANEAAMHFLTTLIKQK